MIRKRQIRFIIVSMSVLFCVLAAILVILGVSAYCNVVQEADEVLEILSENKGRFPKGEDKFGNGLPPHMSPETPYESRYFSVVLDKDTSSVIYVETSKIIAINTTTAISYAELALEGRECGFVEHFRYGKYVEDDIVRIIFLDCGRKLDFVWNFIFTSAGVIFAAYLAVFVLVAFFSQHIMKPVSESYEKQKRFITDAGHEIKTPLAIIQADADVLEMEIGENEWLDDIQRQAKRLTALTNDLVYLARMEEAEHSVQMIDFAISDVVSEAVASFQALAQTKGIQFRCNIQPMLSWRGNEQAIHQLVTILLDNALKYCSENGVVSVALERQGKNLHLCVYNTTDQVIPKENLAILFERFYRSDPSRNSQSGGYGIGLSIAKAIVDAHCGKVSAKTEDGKSLEIKVTLGG